MGKISYLKYLNMNYKKVIRINYRRDIRFKKIKNSELVMKDNIAFVSSVTFLST
ncbi:MAG: hypothetical protein P9L97_11050 [Candidatus Tenebribacter davisii]|nr:hypothetical protein [Candidatus Tenebribacter davisii]